MPFIFFDRFNKNRNLSFREDETVRELLLRNRIPPSSVLTTCDGQIIADYEVINPNKKYKSKLIEGYHIENIINSLPLTPPNTSGVYQKRRLLFNEDGSLLSNNESLTIEETCDMVINNIIDTIEHFDLIEENEKVLIGLSGGVDSSSLLIAMNEAMSQGSKKFKIVAVTFEDFDSRTSPTYTHAKQLADSYNSEHHIVPANTIEEAFSLNTPLREILPKLMKTEHAPMTMYIDHHTTRRALEIFATNNNIKKISLGLHYTDLMAGLLNGFSSGYTVGSLPLRKIGELSYIYPLAFIQKKELHIYHYAKTGALARHSSPNEWEQNPIDRNFYYYVSDMLQEIWPGIENYIFSAHNWRLRRETPISQESCSNCGSTLLTQPFMPISSSECEVCQILKAAGFRKS